MSDGKHKGFGLAGWRIREQLACMSPNEKQFAIYLEGFEPSICNLMREWGYTSRGLYSAVMQALKKFGDQKELTDKDLILLRINSDLINKPSFRKHAPAAYQRFLLCGAYFSACSLADKSLQERFLKLHRAFPNSPLMCHWFERMAAAKETTRRHARQSSIKRHERTRAAKAAVIEQWEKFKGDKATAASFATKLSGGDDDAAKPEFWRDIETNEPLKIDPVSRKTVAKWVNEYRRK